MTAEREISCRYRIRNILAETEFWVGQITWKGFQSFKSYVWASIVSANLPTIARKQLA